MPDPDMPDAAMPEPDMPEPDMPDMPGKAAASDEQFTVHVDADELARQQLAEAAPPAGVGREARRAAEHHGARDDRQAARQQSERARSGRASGTGGGRSYAFRRS